jgi:hypothetical protein
MREIEERDGRGDEKIRTGHLCKYAISRRTFNCSRNTPRTLQPDFEIEMRHGRVTSVSFASRSLPPG